MKRVRFFIILCCVPFFFFACASLKNADYSVPDFSELSLRALEKDIEEGREIEAIQTVLYLKIGASEENAEELEAVYQKALLAAENSLYISIKQKDYIRAIALYHSFETVLETERLSGLRLPELYLAYANNEIGEGRVVPGLLILQDRLEDLKDILSGDDLLEFSRLAFEQNQQPLMASLAALMETNGMVVDEKYTKLASMKFAPPDMQKGTVTVLVNRGIKLEGGVGFPDMVIGSGFFIDKSGYILTNYHVIASEVDPEYEGFSRLYVRPHDSIKDRIPARVIGYDRIFDIALLKVELEAPFVISLRDRRTARPGERIYAIGSPGGLENTITSGIVSATGRRFLQLGDTIQVDVPINPGNSGGPLLDGDGDLVGLVFAGIVQFEGVNFAIPSYWFKRLVPRLYAGGELVHPWLGIAVNEESNGLRTMYVLPGGPGHTAGVERHDIIASINGRNVGTLAEAQDILLSLYPSTLITVGINRGGEKFTRTIALGKRPFSPVDTALERDIKENVFVPLFGFTLNQAGESRLSRSYIVKDVFKGSIADETGISVDDPLNIQRWIVDKKNRIAALQIFIKKRKVGFMETAIQLAAYLEVDYFI